jgi:hypothetical protein
MYVVVRFPKNLNGAKSFDLNVYTKTHSQKEKMIGYYEEQKARHTDCIVILTTKENAKMLKAVWYNYIGKNHGREKSRDDKMKSIFGHNPENDSHYVARMRKIYG